LILTHNNHSVSYGYMRLYPNKQLHVKVEDVQAIFRKYNIVSEHPIDYLNFVDDIHNITTVTYTQVIDTSSIPQYSFNSNEQGTTVISHKQVS